MDIIDNSQTMSAQNSAIYPYSWQTYFELQLQFPDYANILCRIEEPNWAIVSAVAPVKKKVCCYGNGCAYTDMGG